MIYYFLLIIFSFFFIYIYIYIYISADTCFVLLGFISAAWMSVELIAVTRVLKALMLSVA